MRRLRRSLLLASILVAAPLTLTASLPASAQFSASIGFDSFHGQLANYGDWLYSDRWGEVWRPDTQDRDQDWRPYWAGHWVDTDEYGWTWISDEGGWGDIAYHYGRWVNDPDDGWLWLPGYVWSPAWVVWRSSGPDVGWMPMPPDDDFLRPSGISIGVSFGDWNDTGGYYGYSRWYGSRFDENRFGNLWVFVPGGRLSDPGYRRYALARPQTINIVRQSRNITNYTVVNNVIINRSVNIDAVRGSNGRAPQAVRANTVLRNNRWIAPVNQGEQIQQRARQERPHGNGLANSAPPPNQQQIQSLSTRAIPVRTQNNAPGNNAPGNTPNSGPNNGPNNGPNDRGGSHLFNRNNAAQFTARQQAQPSAQPAQPQAQPQQAQPNQPPPQSGGNDNNRGRDNRRDDNGPGNNRPQNNVPDSRGPQAGPPPTPNNPASAATPLNTPAERNRGFERPQQQQTPATPPPTPTPPVTREAAPVSPPAEQRGNGPDRGNRGPQQNFQRPQAEAPQTAPNSPPQQQDRGNRPDRNFDRGQQTPATVPPATVQRPQAVPERPTPPAAPPREAPRPPAPPPQAQPQRQPEAARPNPPADRGASDRNDQRDKRDNDNK